MRLSLPDAAKAADHAGNNSGDDADGEEEDDGDHDDGDEEEEEDGDDDGEEDARVMMMLNIWAHCLQFPVCVQNIEIVLN